MMHVMVLIAALMSVPVFAGNSNNRPAACDEDVKQEAAATAEAPASVQLPRSEVDEKRNKVREDLIEKTAKKVALRCVKASPWANRLMVDDVGEPTEAFKKAAALPVDKLKELIVVAKEQSYFCTSGYMLLREIYEGVLEAALPQGIGEQVVSSQEVARQITDATRAPLPNQIALIVNEYACLHTLKSIPEMLDAYHRNQWHITDEKGDWFSPDIPECREFCDAHKFHYPFPYDDAQLKRIEECGFKPVGIGLRPDRISCFNCDTQQLQSNDGLGRVTGLFLTWKVLTRYHKPDCKWKKEGAVALSRRQVTGRYKSKKTQGGPSEYGCKVPNNVAQPAEFLVYLLRHTDIFARAHLPQGRAAQTELEVRSYSWVQGLARVEDHVLKAEAMIQYFKQKEANQTLVVGDSRVTVLPQHFSSSDAKKKQGPDDAATPE
jgi:hypothetical protein